ncbi:PrsW family intramembrane metalloprotease [Telmatocola sphagniphila]|uniref:PrsW family intramembrane metalloprotease n=1 Tax=Telmatocola sphagniphila TaxID=1123043 RepID=A0A8E6B5S1_9BACT|nr:PrsW family glutamic-type intramembrane protease [Telmatocola sphagniphila]QVL31656.1 PrsW family intramembrane metalloprotease [Telmatocola sphagniphila]
MPIAFRCESCQVKLKAPDGSSGRSIACPGCKTRVTIPTPPSEDEVAAALLLDSPISEDTPSAPEVNTSEPDCYDSDPLSKTERKNTLLKQFEDPPQAKIPVGGQLHAPPSKPKVSPVKSNDPPGWFRHLHWLLIAALIPLAFSLLRKPSEADEPIPRLLRTLENSNPEVEHRITAALESSNDPEAAFERIFEILPQHKFDGAFLPRNSKLHWLFAGLSATVFLIFIYSLSLFGTADPKRLLWIGLFTGTVGVLMLFLFQYIADATYGVTLIGRSVLIIFFYIVKFIGFSYRAATDPDNGFLLSFVGFTLGVGFCEEVCKAVPLLFKHSQQESQSWRNAFLWGMASSAGFGISEAVVYAGGQYNGISSSGIYLVRFISCVALHALWTGSAAITIQQKPDWVNTDGWFEYGASLFRILAIPIVLHGLYDTFLKKDMNALALLTALASFGYLAFQLSRLQGEDDRNRTDAMLRDYQRKKKAMA